MADTNKKLNMIDSVKQYNKEIEKNIFGDGSLKNIPDPTGKSTEINGKLDDIESSINDNNTGKGFIELYQAIANHDSSSRVGNNNDIKTKKMIESSLNGSNVNPDQNRINKYNDYDTIEECIPELAICLDVYRDSILSPDDVSKRSIAFKYNANNNLDQNKSIPAYNKIQKIIDKHKLNERIPNDIREAMKFGDLFIMVLNINESTKEILNENTELRKNLFPNEDVVLEANDFTNPEDIGSFTKLLETLNSDTINKLIPMMEDDNTNPKNNKALANQLNDIYKKNSLFTKDKKKNNIDFEKLAYNLAKNTAEELNKRISFNSDPLVTVGSALKNDKIEDSFKAAVLGENLLKGAYVKELDPRKVIKLEIDGNCFGYIYLDPTEGYNISNFGADTGSGVETPTVGDNYQQGSMLQTISSSIGMGSAETVSSSSNSNISGNTTKADSESNTGNTALQYQIITDIFIKGICKKLDKKFVEDNEELHNTIYSLIKTEDLLNKDVKMTFLLPNEVKHFKLDSTGTYGVSRFSKSYFFSKLYLATLITNINVKVTKGRDRKAYYVDVGMDAGVEDVVQSLITDMRSKEISTADISSDSVSITTMLNKMGAGAEMYVPTIDGKRLPDILAIVCRRNLLIAGNLILLIGLEGEIKAYM